MAERWYRAIFSIFLIILIGVNMAYTFNLLNVVNPTSLDMDYSGSWFSFTSFSNNFKTYFNQNDTISGLNDFLHSYANFIGKMYSMLVSVPQTIASLSGSTDYNWSIIGMIFAIFVIITNVIPTILVVFYGVILIFTALIYVITFLLFILSFFSGAFSSPLPSTYPELNEPLAIIRGFAFYCL